MRGLPVLLAGVVVVLAATLVVPATASAQPTTVAGLLAHYYDLSQQAELVNEELLVVQEQLATQQQASAAATTAADEAKAAAADARGRVDAAQDIDRVADALSSRSDLDALSAFANSTSPDDLLGKLEAANLAQHLTGAPRQGDVALAEADAAAKRAVAAQTAAQTAEATVAASATEVQGRRAELDAQITEVRAALDNLTPEQRELLTGIEDFTGEVVIPGGDAGSMLEFALAQRGKPYIWGAEGPDSYDCSGLVQTAFRTIGVSVPRVSRQQARIGMQVSRAEVRAGDLVFFFEPVHHVAIAIDNTYAVHAPTFGDVVKISAMDNIGPITGIRRVIG